MVEVIGATITVCSSSITSGRVRISTCRRLSGRGKEYCQISARFIRWPYTFILPMPELTGQSRLLRIGLPIGAGDRDAAPPAQVIRNRTPQHGRPTITP